MPATARPGRLTVLPSGEQFEISSGGHRATIVEVGGGLREYEVDEARPLTEPEKRDAIHGFLLWRPWDAVEGDADRAVMAARLYPLDGYPFALDIRVAYQLGPEGLTVTTTAENVGECPCPYGHGQHPYLSPGRGLIDDCTLQLAGRTRICTDAERQLPTGANRCGGRSTTSSSRGGSTPRASTTPSPIWCAIPPVAPGRGCGAPTERAPSCGWTRHIRSSRPTPATPSLPPGRAAALAQSR